MTRLTFAAAVLAALASSRPRPPAGRSIQAVDGTDADGSDNRWTPDNVTVKVGETVTWSFDGHARSRTTCVRRAPTGTSTSPTRVGGPPATYTFATPGTYTYVCRSTRSMTGTVTVTDATGTPPPRRPRHR